MRGMLKVVLTVACTLTALAGAGGVQTMEVSADGGTVTNERHRSLLWRLPVGCDFSGFFVELLGYLGALDARFRLAVDVGECTEEMFAKLPAAEGALLRRLQSERAAAKAATAAPAPEIVVQHTTPCGYLDRSAFGSPPPLLSVGRSMTEGAKLLSAREVRCCERVDQIWLPTEAHVQVRACGCVCAGAVCVGAFGAMFAVCCAMG